MGKAYDKARLGSRGVLNPENKKKLGDAYFKMRKKVLDKRKKRIEKGTFDKEKEVQARVAHNKKNYGKGVFGHDIVTGKEELVGGQKKLDVNKNKRLDSQDFALLREKEIERKVQKHEDIAQRGYSARMTKTSKAAKRGEKLETKHDAASLRLLKRSQKEADSPRTYGRGGKLVKRGSRAEVKEGMEQIDEYSQSGGSSAKAGRMVRDTPRTRHGYMQGTQKLTTDYSVSGGKGKMKTDGWKKFETDTEGKPVGVTKSRLRRLKKQGVVEGVEQIDEAGQAKLERLGKAYDKARLGSRGVLNPENKKKLGDAYFKMREKVLAAKVTGLALRSRESSQTRICAEG